MTDLFLDVLGNVFLDTEFTHCFLRLLDVSTTRDLLQELEKLTKIYSFILHVLALS